MALIQLDRRQNAVEWLFSVDNRAMDEFIKSTREQIRDMGRNIDKLENKWKLQGQAAVKSIQDAESNVQHWKDEVKRLESTYNALSDKTSEIAAEDMSAHRNAMREVARLAEQADQNVKDYEAELQKVNTTSQQHVRQIQRAEDFTNRLKVALAKTGKEGEDAMREIDKEVDDLFRSANKVDQEFGQWASTLVKAHRNLDKINDRYRQLDTKGEKWRKHTGIVRGNMAKMMPYMAGINTAMQGIQAATQATAVAMAALVGFWAQGAHNVRRMNKELAEQRNIAMQGGLDRRWLGTEIETARLAGADIDANAYAQFAERIGEAALDPESEQGRIISRLLEPSGISAIEASVQDVINAIEQLGTDSGKFFMYNTIAGGEFAEQALIASQVSDRRRKQLEELTDRRVHYEDIIRRTSEAVGMATKSAEGMYNSLTIAMAPELERVSDEFSQVASRMSDIIRHSPAIQSLIGKLGDISVFLLNTIENIVDMFITKEHEAAIAAGKAKEEADINLQKSFDKRAAAIEKQIDANNRMAARLRDLFAPLAKENLTNINILTMDAMQTKEELRQILPAIECLDERTSDTGQTAEENAEDKIMQMFSQNVTARMDLARLKHEEESAIKGISVTDKEKLTADAVHRLRGKAGGLVVSRAEKQEMNRKETLIRAAIDEYVAAGGTENQQEMQALNRYIDRIVNTPYFTPAPRQQSFTIDEPGFAMQGLPNAAGVRRQIEEQTAHELGIDLSSIHTPVHIGGTINDIENQTTGAVNNNSPVFNQTINVEGNMDEETAEYIANSSRGALSELSDTLN